MNVPQQQQQQQYMAQQYQQQAMNVPSLHDLMAEHQKQWQEHQIMTGSTPNLNMYQQQQRQSLHQPNVQFSSSTGNLYNNMGYQPPTQHNVSISQMNLYQYNNIQQQHQHQQMMAMQQQRAYAMQQQQMHSQRAVFQQQARNHYASTGQLGLHNQMQSSNNQNKQFASQNNVSDIVDEHASFVPPPPQSNAEIEKYVKYKAKRKGIQNQKMIDAKIKAEQEMVSMAKESEKRGNYNDPFLEEPLLKSESIDYTLRERPKNDDGGCCCVV